MAAHNVAAASPAPGIKPNLLPFVGTFGTNLVLNSQLNYSSTELTDIRDSSVIITSEKLKSALGRQRLLRTTEWRSRIQEATGKRK